MSFVDYPTQAELRRRSIAPIEFQKPATSWKLLVDQAARLGCWFVA
jgi:hypothetical protein